MKIAIASGKGGTGKTTVATNLAAALSEKDLIVTYLDCDVEEPNGHIFLNPVIENVISIGIPVPEVDDRVCDHCKKCADICQFNAIACFPQKTLVFSELCHGCGGCMLVCPQKAIKEKQNIIGVVEKGNADKVRFVQGRLNVGHAMSPPLIRAVKQEGKGEGVYIFDCPPGTSCPVIEAIRDVDFTILVTEPTPFGLNDLKLAVDMLRELKQPMGIIINRYDIGDKNVEKYCLEEKLDVLLKLPDNKIIAQAYSRGQMAINALPEYHVYIKTLFNKIKKRFPK